MGLKKMFMKKDPTEEEIREELNRVGISTKSGHRREEKFGAFKNYAQERQSNRQNLGPVLNPYKNLDGNINGGNPYSNENNNPNNNNNNNPYGGNSNNNPYGSNSNSNLNPNKSEPSSTSSPSASPSPYGNNSPYNSPYARAKPVSQPPPRTKQHRLPQQQRIRKESYKQVDNDNDSESLDLNQIPSNIDFGTGKKPINRKVYNEEIDLNEEYQEDDLNLDIDEEQEQVNSEDEEVEAIKQDIRFVKKESVQSTRNTLTMAQEANASGTNTLGMLGSQSERLYNAEQNLLLADTQTQIADEKVKELKRLNRSIFVPAYGNPFNRKSRLRAQEEKIKNQKLQEKYLREEHRRGIYESEQRVKAGITEGNSELSEKYRDAKNLKLSERYRFEGDSEDEDMEIEIANNLHEIGKYSSQLNQKAKAINTEIDQQNIRLRQIEEDADKLDINVHMNSTRLSNIR
ncbi:unnamed protein product [Candida verbasci]|uniref:t-SNARE coiled-coil homology domain-containing protein n=1 Tax=Candida verbasci TaxID=1227364 RepID=A0A9W4U3D2_9ASCO|nr:unnamed protein product [Candida verbasci]